MRAGPAGASKSEIEKYDEILPLQVDCPVGESYSAPDFDTDPDLSCRGPLMMREEPSFEPPQSSVASQELKEQTEVPTMVQLMPIRTRLNLVLPFAPVIFNLVAWFLYLLLPGILLEIARTFNGPSAHIVNLLGSSTGGRSAAVTRVIPVNDLIVHNLVISADIALALTSVVLAVSNVVSYRSCIADSVQYRHGMSAEEWFGKHRTAAICMVAFPLLWIAELVLGGLTLRYFEVRIDGPALSFTHFMFRVSVFFVLVTPLLTFGLQVLLFPILARFGASDITGAGK